MYQGFAHQIVWISGVDVGYAILTNSDVGGTFLRSLAGNLLRDAAAGVKKRNWYKM